MLLYQVKRNQIEQIRIDLEKSLSTSNKTGCPEKVYKAILLQLEKKD